MEQFIGTSPSGELSESVRGLNDPQFIILSSGDKTKFAAQVEQLEKLFPGVPSIGCVGQSYGGAKVIEKGITVTAFKGNITAVTGVMTNVSTMPVKCIAQFEKNLSKIGGDPDHTVCIDYCSGNDESLLATFESVLRKKKISITGGTAWEGLVCCNGKVYPDACTYAFVRNNGGRIKVYKENLYLPTEKRHICTKAIPSQYIVCEFDGKPAEDVYAHELNIAPSDIINQTFTNPLGRCIGDNIFITSLKERMNNKTFSCYRKINPKDSICILKLGDYEEIINQTIQEIEHDFPHRSGVLSVNCILRYQFFEQRHFTEKYFNTMTKLGPHSGLIGLGEHYNGQHTNQTMSCVVFE